MNILKRIKSWFYKNKYINNNPDNISIEPALDDHSDSFKRIKNGKSSHSTIFPSEEEHKLLSQEVINLIRIIIDLPIAQKDQEMTQMIVRQLLSSVERTDAQSILNIASFIYQYENIFDYIEREVASGPLFKKYHRSSVINNIKLKEISQVESALTEISTIREIYIPILNNIFGNPELKSLISDTNQFFDSNLEEYQVNTITSLSESNYLVMIRKQMDRIEKVINNNPDIRMKDFHKLLDLALKTYSVPLPQLRWFITKGEAAATNTVSGDILPADFDVMWEAVRRLSLFSMLEKEIDRKRKTLYVNEFISEIAHLNKTFKEIIWFRQIISASRTTDIDTQAIQILGESRLSDSKTHFNIARDNLPGDSDWREYCKVVLENTELNFDPRMAVGLIDMVLDIPAGGTFTWEMCIELANSRAKKHIYLYEGKRTIKYTFKYLVKENTDGSLTIEYGVVQMQLRTRFKEKFNSQGIVGRLKILWELVEYASSFHNQDITIGKDAILEQIQFRDDELYTRVSEKIP